MSKKREDKSLSEIRSGVIKSGNKKLKVVLFLLLALVLVGSAVAIVVLRDTEEEPVEELTAEEQVAEFIIDAEAREKEFKNLPKPDEILSEYEQAISRAEDTGDSIQIFNAYSNAAFAAKDANRNAKAKEYAQKALEYVDELPDETRDLSAGFIINLEEIANG